ncbi:hypothetical protein NEAUS07_0764 [Nematocida ausubeli]|nr:hypothetical protein NEAUS07_0585 [Nematocida ausubeli]KAI5134232.1 hypothetical protein NEAUS07_0764 [Nematocida ausubeli]
MLRTDKVPHKTVLFALSVLLRTYNIANPSSVVFDENHYAKFILMYIKGETVVDVHPPLGRLLVYGITKIYLRHINVPDEFDEASVSIGKTYANTILSSAYIVLRAASAITSCISVVAGHEILTELNVSKGSALLFSTLLLFDGSMFSIFRLFMIDSYVLSSISLILLSLLKMNRQRYLLQRIYRSQKGILQEINISPKDHHSALTPILTNSIKNTTQKHMNTKKDEERKRTNHTVNKLQTAYIQAIKWSVILGISLGIGSAFKWAVLPMGAPIALYLLTDLITAKKKSLSKRRLLLPVLQGTIILLIAIVIYTSTFIVNFSVQNRSSEKTIHWHSFSYNASFTNSPYIEYVHDTIPPYKLITIAIPEISHFLTVSNQTFSISRVPSAEPEWKIIPQKTMEYGMPVYIQHTSGLYLSTDPSFLSYTPSVLYISKYKKHIAIKSHSGSYLNLSETQTATWSPILQPVLLLQKRTPIQQTDSTIHGTLADTKRTIRNIHPYSSTESIQNSTKSSRICSSTIEPSSLIERIIESNKVMYLCNKTVTGSHAYKSLPAAWLYKQNIIHLWSGSVSEFTDPLSSRSIEIFLVQNPVLLISASIGLVIYLILVLTTELPQALSHFLVLTAYVSNYLPYFLIARDRYIHHYIPSYYISILILGGLLYRCNYSVLLVCAAAIMHMVQLPILQGSSAYFEQCCLSLYLSNRLSSCAVFPSILE